jgi:hypothetical protein
MSELSFKTYSDKFSLVFGDKKKYSSLLKQVNSRWSNKLDAWLVPVENDEKLKQLVSILYPEQKQKKSPSPKKVVKKVGRKPKQVDAPPSSPVVIQTPMVVEKPVVTEEVIEKVKEIETIPKSSPSNKDLAKTRNETKKFRRSRSPLRKSNSSDDESENSNDPVKYYKTFQHSPNTFSNLHDNDDFILSSSDEESDSSSSSEDYPKTSPNRKKLINENVFDEMDKLRKRLYQLEQKK